jgi:galactonate dehydratase
LQRRLVDVLMPDVKHDVRPDGTVAIAGAARAAGLLVAPHNPSGPVACAATALVELHAEQFRHSEIRLGRSPLARRIAGNPPSASKTAICCCRREQGWGIG